MRDVVRRKLCQKLQNLILLSLEMQIFLKKQTLNETFPKILERQSGNAYLFTCVPVEKYTTARFNRRVQGLKPARTPVETAESKIAIVKRFRECTNFGEEIERLFAHQRGPKTAPGLKGAVIVLQENTVIGVPTHSPLCGQIAERSLPRSGQSQQQNRLSLHFDAVCKK